jgi:hypothetical protein
MAIAGGGAGFARLQTPEDGIPQALQFWGAQEAKKEADSRLAQEREGVRKDAEMKTWEDTYNVKAEDFQSKYTGFKSYDDMSTDFSLNTTAQYVDLQRQAKEAMLSGNVREKSRLQGEMIKVKGAFKEASKSQATLGKIYTDYQTAVREGKVSGASKDFENAMQAGFKDMNIALRYKDGALVYTGVDKDGKIVVIPNQDIMDGSFTWTEKQDLYGKDGIIKNLVGNLGTTSKDSFSKDGYTKTTTQVWNEEVQGKATNSSIDALLGSDDVMSDLLYQMTQGKTVKRGGFDEKDYDLVKKELMGQIKGGYSEVVKKDFESGRYGTDVSAALRKQEMAIEANKPKNLSKEDAEYGARRYNISEIAKGDTSFFNSGSFKYGGQNYESKGAVRIGNNIVIQTDSGSIKIPMDNQTAINNMLNSFEGKTTTFDQAMSVKPFAWRVSSIQKGSNITQTIKGQYDSNGKFIGEETAFKRSIKELYPDAEVEEINRGRNGLSVNGVEIDLDKMSQVDVEEALRGALNEPSYKKARESNKQEKLNW